MVRSTKYLFAILRLIRWPNLVMVIVTQCLMRWCIIAPMLKYNGLSDLLNTLDFFLLVFATVALTAAGYVINDYFDRQIDQVNHPDKVIISRVINPRAAMALHMILTFAGLLSGFTLVYSLHLYHFALIFIIVSGILWFYSTTYKRQFLIGNLIVSLLTGLVPLMVIIFEIPLIGRKYGSIADAMGLNTNEMVFWVMSFSVFAFLLTLIREIIKDTEDFEGDNAYGLQTLPIVLGVRWTKIILQVLMTLLVIAIICFLLFKTTNRIAIVYLTAFILLPMAIISYLTVKASAKEHYHTISLILKFIMVMGILFAIILRYFIIT